MSGFATRIPPAIFVQSLNQANVVSNISTSATAGVAVPNGRRHEVAWLAATKLAAANVDIHGFANLGTTPARWLFINCLRLAEARDEVALVRGVAAFTRLQTSINGIGTTNLNSYWGFSE